MTSRKSSADRQADIVGAALELLGRVPVRDLTTRLVAAEVGVSQPALFRHFASRDALLAAVVLHARRALLREMTAALEGRDSLEGLEQVVGTLFRFVETNPGLPRLLFFDASEDQPAEAHAPLRDLVAAQRAFVSDLVERGQQNGEIPARLPAELAGFVFVSLVQGALLQWLLGGRKLDLSTLGRDVVVGFWAALGIADDLGTPSRRAERPQPHQAIVSIDARSHIQKGEEPLEAILAAFDQVLPDGMLEVIAPFRPAPLLELMRQRAAQVHHEELDEHTHRVWIRPRAQCPFLDLRDLEAPLPLEHALRACDQLESGGSVLLAVPQVPRFLFPHLHQRGFEFLVHESIDGCALLRVTRRREGDTPDLREE